MKRSRQPASKPGSVQPGKARRGMFNVSGSGDTSGFGGLRLPAHVAAPAERPYGAAGLGSKYRGQRGPTASRYSENFNKK